MTIPAKYENGVFRPLEAIQIEEGTVVEVLLPPEPGSTEQRGSIASLPFRAVGGNGPLSSGYGCHDRDLAGQPGRGIVC